MNNNFIGDSIQIKVLGSGGQARTYLVSKGNRQLVAKVYEQNDLTAFEREAAMLEKLNHQNIIKIVGKKADTIVSLPNEPEIVRPVIWLEYAQNQTMAYYVYKCGKFTQEQARTLIRQILNGVIYLHEQNVAHRDLKLLNIVFDSQFQPKICDFGLASKLKDSSEDLIVYNHRIGTKGFQAPEMLERNQTGIIEYTGLTDFFAIGVVLFQLVRGDFPFSVEASKQDEYYKYIYQDQAVMFWKIVDKDITISTSLRKLLTSFLARQVSKRPTLESLAQDEWLNGPTCSFSQMAKQLTKRRQIIKNRRQNIRRGLLENQGIIQEHHNINPNALRLSLDRDLIFARVNPQALVSNFQNWLKFAFRSKNIFVQDPIFQAQPLNYSAKYIPEKLMISVKLQFLCVNHLAGQQVERREFIREIGVNGQLVRNLEGRSSFEWKDFVGNLFWIKSFLAEVDNMLESLPQ